MLEINKGEQKMLTELQIHDKIVALENEIDQILINKKSCDTEDYELHEMLIRRKNNIKHGLLIALEKVK